MHLELGDNALARRWLSGWAQREGVRPWMLYNLVLALVRERAWEEALAVSRAALALPPDNTTNDHAAWLLADQALAPDLRAALEGARRLEGAALDGRFEFLRSLALAVLGLRTARQDFAWFRAEIGNAERRFPSFAREPDLRHAYVRSVWRAARAQRGLAATLWALVRCWRAEQDAPLAALLRMLKEQPPVLAPPPPKPLVAPQRRRAADA